MMNHFSYHLPVNLIFGSGESKCIGKHAAALGKRALIVTGGSSTKRSGLLEAVQRQLEEKGMSSVLFDRVTPNPLTTTVYEGAALALDEGCDVVIGIGGGSSIDAAKGIAFQTANGGDINRYIFGQAVSDLALPVIAVPTTCGTGSEGNGFAVLTNPETMDKKSLRCKAIVPACSIVDPFLMITMPKATMASCGFDALCHCMEAYVSHIAQPMSSMLAMEGIRLVSESLVQVFDDPADLEGWEKLSLASTLGGMAIHTSGVVLPHGMEHPVSGLMDVVHGRGLAALTPVIIEESASGAPDRYGVISRLLGGKNAKDCSDRIRELLGRLDLSFSLGQLGVKEQDIEWMTENCFKVSAAGIANHPVAFGHQDIRRIYEKAI